MAVEWFYLVNETEFGPISGKQLKELADSGAIIPRTAVRRTKGTDRSPWTRAGAIKELFPGDVVEQLGGPICDDCGIVLEANGSCLKCARVVPPPLPTEPPISLSATSAPDAPQSIPSSVPREQKYKNLRKYVSLIRTLAFLVQIASCLIAIAVIAFAFITGQGPLGMLTAVGGAVVWVFGGYVAYVVQMALAEFLEVVMDIEENTRHSARNGS